MANENKPPKQSDPFNPAKPAPTVSGPGVSAPEPPPKNAQQEWDDKATAFLLSKGWEKSGVTYRGETLWQDPLSHPVAKAEPKPSVNLPAVGGGTEVIMQWHTPPISWPMTTEQAYWVQLDRDKDGEGLDSIIARKERELEALKSKSAAEKEDAKTGKKVKVA